MTGPLLEVRDLKVHFGSPGGSVSRAVDGVSFDVAPGETLAIVGESGCGKSLTALSLARLVDEPPARTVPGSSIRLHGEELVGAQPGRLRAIRGAQIGFVFQEPMTSLNPVYRVGRQVEEAIRAHGAPAGSTAKRARDLLERVGLPEPRAAALAYPHELSGGMRQRVLIAMAIASEPSLLIADEPTTALDVTVQAQILGLLADLRDEIGMALLLISHDLAVVGSVADRVAVMYGGRFVEEGRLPDVLVSPRHPYTRALLAAVPTVEDPDRSLEVIPGRVPSPESWPAGCRFHPRCRHAWNRCSAAQPAMSEGLRCWLAEEPERRTQTSSSGGRP